MTALLRMCCYALCLGLAVPVFAQRKKKNRASLPDPEPTISSADYFQGMKWRNIGPFRGGRSTAVTGVPQDPMVFYFGSTGGGVWKTSDAGNTWRNISDGYFKTGSVGAIAVAPSDPNVLYVGMGEAPVRGVMTSHGDGVYRSLDAGKSWEQIGLSKVRQISKIRIHPTNPEVLYVAAQGSPYEGTEERGVYRSMDGGMNWEKVLFVDENSGACDLSMDAHNPRILYAAFWDHQRLPWQMRSGGPGSSIWKSTDAGNTWQKLTQGLPSATMGKIGIAVSPARASRVWAIIESEEGGLYRSDNGGQSWRLINDHRKLRARSWYYMHVFADPVNPDGVYVLNAPFFRSTDGGSSFRQISTPHGDNHDLWIHPTDPNLMINGNDGGANISYNWARTWSTQSNQPTAQFYRVNADNQLPYRVYGGQQDNSSVSIPNQTNSFGIRNEDFYSVGGCESAYCAFDPDNPKEVFAGCYQGIITRWDAELRTEKDVMAYPTLGLGTTPSEQKYRFNWNAPILASIHDPSLLYHAGNVLLKSSDRGQSWEEISPDLTRNNPEHLIAGGGPITNEGAGGEVYHTLMYVAESPHDPQTIWAGADDGLVHITRDGGENWQNITPPALRETEGMVNTIEVSPFDPGVAYLAVTRYKFNDFTPYFYRTADYGQSWTLLTEGIAGEAHVRVVRADPERKGLLYLGTETGLYVSMDDGQKWETFQLNLPIVPITDLKVHQGDLIAATQGRAFWVLDDLRPLRQATEEVLKANFHVFPPRAAHFFGGPRNDTSRTRGTNPYPGSLVQYYLSDSAMGSGETLSATVVNAAGETVREFSSDANKRSNRLPMKAGINQWSWNLRHASFEMPSGLMVIGGSRGAMVAPGSYTLHLMMGPDTFTHPLEIQPDPRLDMSAEAYEENEVIKQELADAIESLYQGVKAGRQLNGQLHALSNRLSPEEQEALLKDIDLWQEEWQALEVSLVQSKQETFQDVINFPNQLDANLLHALNGIDGTEPPLTQGQKTRAAELLAIWATKADKLEKLLGERTEAINEAVNEANIPFLFVE
ncbi:MAG: glycosyl hydrolase [Bacteroidota bacterium]